jgi:hypothetical protein
MQRIKPIKHDKKGFNFIKPNVKIPKIPDIKSLIFGKQPEYGSPVNATGSGLGATSAFLPVKDIRDGIIITNDNRYIKVLEILPVLYLDKGQTKDKFNLL